MHIAALFDMDGLLIDSERAIMHTWQIVAMNMGTSLSKETYLSVVRCSSSQGDTILAEAFGSRQRYELARSLVVQTLQTTYGKTGFGLKPGVEALLSELAARRVPCAVASSSSKHESEERLAAEGIREYFAAIAGGNEVEREKPDPAEYILASKRLGVHAKDCIAFEGSHNGSHAAFSAGASLVIVPDLIQPTNELTSMSFCILQSLEDALPNVDRWFNAVQKA